MQRYKKIGKMLVKKKIWKGGGGEKLLAQDTRQKFFAKGNKTAGTKMSIYAS